MSNWREFVEYCCVEEGKIQFDKSRDLKNDYGIYSGSVHASDECTCFMTWEGGEKVLVVAGGKETDRFEGRDLIIGGRKIRICPLNTANSQVIRRIFAFTNPSANDKHDMSIGLGDRLGLASPGHIRLIGDKGLFPVLAQQSIRELTLTNRTFQDVLSSAVWAVFQEGYAGGYGADGDHLKTEKEVRYALDCDYTMITLDCSEHINNSVENMPEAAIIRQFCDLDENEKKYWENKYKNKTFGLGSGLSIYIPETALMKTVLMYNEVLGFIENIYHHTIKPYGRKIDFEISIDETSSSTSPEIHYIIASELKDRGVAFMSLAPRFCGEFQKGIDYKGDLDQFRRELEYHVAISRHFGYKISIHSGSDKFSVFPAIGELAGNKFHLKTAGTNWLEAIGVIAAVDRELFLSIYEFALKKLDDAKKYYHIHTEKHMVPEFQRVAEDPTYHIRNHEAVRQVLHVTYGYILCEKDADNKFVFRDKIYDTLNKYEEKYYDALYKHIGNHLLGLGI